MGANINLPLRVFRRGQHPNENYVFTQILARARFARSMQHAIDEYIEFAHRTIEGFYFTVVSAIVLPLASLPSMIWNAAEYITLGLVSDG